MKKTLIGSIVGGLIIFLWQFLSWAAINLHRAGQEYTPKQDSILSYLGSQLDKDGTYMMPNAPAGTSHEEMEKQMEARLGKPWAVIEYHQSLSVNMGMSMVRELLSSIIMIAMLIWILLRLSVKDFGTLFTACLFTGVIVFINVPYSVHIWYPKADIWAYFLDAVISWTLVGIWLGWWLGRKSRQAA